MQNYHSISDASADITPLDNGSEGLLNSKHNYFGSLAKGHTGTHTFDRYYFKRRSCCSLVIRPSPQSQLQ
jgi:hypothetical protein